MDQRDYTLLTGADLQRCTTGSVTICSAEVPLYHAQLMTCEGSLYFQSSDGFQLCRKILLHHYRTPTPVHHGSKWAYRFPEPRQVTIRCPQENGRSSRTVSLVGSGLLHNASACHISSHCTMQTATSLPTRFGSPLFQFVLELDLFGLARLHRASMFTPSIPAG